MEIAPRAPLIRDASSIRADRQFLAAGFLLAALGLLYFVMHPAFAYTLVGRARLVGLLQQIGDLPPKLTAMWVHLGTSTGAQMAAYAAIIGLACGAHMIALRAARRKSSSRAAGVVVGFAIASTVLVAGLPIHSVDVFTYLSIAEIADRGLDPYAEAPIQHRNLSATQYGPRLGASHPSLYGPLATRLFAWLFSPGRELWINLVLWKFVVSGLVGLTVFLLWDCWRTLGRSAPERLALLVMVAWSPLLLSEGALHGHVDAIVAVFLALGLGQFLRGRETVGLMLLAAAISVKMSFVMLWPVILARAVIGAPTVGRGLARAAIVASGAVIFSALWLFPEPSFGDPVAPIRHIGGWSQNSLAHVLKKVLPGASGPASYVAPAMTGLMLAVFCFRLRAVRDRAVFVRRLSRDYLLYLTIFGQLFHQWYVLPALVLASVSDDSRHRSATLWLAAASLILLPVRRLGPRLGLPGDALQFAIILLPAAILLLTPERRGSWHSARGPAHEPTI